MTTPDAHVPVGPERAEAGTGNEQDRPSRGRDDLRERIARACYEALPDTKSTPWPEQDDEVKGWWHVYADAVLPLIEAAVTEAEERARREALEEAAQIIEQSGSKDPNLRSVTAWLKARAAGGPS